jgi:hypothetical protein
MKCTFAILGVILVCCVLGGCKTSSPAVKLPPPVKTGSLASVDFNFILVSATNSSPDLQAETSLLQDYILSGLRETGLFPTVEEVYTNGAASDGIKISASIKQITKVTKDSRDWFGGLAGKAQVGVTVTVSDLQTSKPIEVFEVVGETGASARAGTTPEAIQQAAAKVVAEIASLNSQAAQELIQQGK